MCILIDSEFKIYVGITSLEVSSWIFFLISAELSPTLSFSSLAVWTCILRLSFAPLPSAAAPEPCVM